MLKYWPLRTWQFVCVKWSLEFLMKILNGLTADCLVYMEVMGAYKWSIIELSEMLMPVPGPPKQITYT